MIWDIYNTLANDAEIVAKAADRIKMYEYPATGDVSGLYIVIDPIGPPKPTDYADNEPTAYDYLFQIDVWSKSWADTSAIAARIEKLLRKEVGFSNTGSGVDQWDAETNIFRDARRYRGKQIIKEAD